MPSFRSLLILLPYIWMLLFFCVPFLFLIKISFSQAQQALPPYVALLHIQYHKIMINLHLTQYMILIKEALYRVSYWNSLKVATIMTTVCLILAYPMAYYLAKLSARKRNFLTLTVILPFWTPAVLRLYAWVDVLKRHGWLNFSLKYLGFLNVTSLYRTNYGVYIAMIYMYLPFLILILLIYLLRLDKRLPEAAYDLGAKPWQVFWHITLPQSKQGIIYGCLFIFVPATGESVVPELLGGANTLMIGKVLWNSFLNATDLPMGAAITCILITIIVSPMTFFRYINKSKMKRSK